LWCDLYKKYMTNCDFFSSKSQEAPNFGKGYKRLTIFFMWGSSTRWEMENKQNFGMMFGWMMRISYHELYNM
jgi:hypothetical protein